jgi:hypothetical protein
MQSRDTALSNPMTRKPTNPLWNRPRGRLVTAFETQHVLLFANGVVDSVVVKSGLENRDYGRKGSAALTMRHPLYPQKLVLTSPTSGGLSVGIVRSRTS